MSSAAVFKSLFRQNLHSRFLRTPGSRLALSRSLRNWSWVYPLALELEYRRWIQRKIEEFRQPFLDHLDRTLATVFPKARLDADEMAQWDLAMGSLRESQKQTFNPNIQQNFIAGVFGFGAKTAALNQKEFDKFAQIAIGSPFHPEEAWVQPMIDQWAQRNYTLIKSLSDLYILKANEIVREGVKEGLVYSEVRDRLRTMDRSMTQKKAQLIARDQIGKLNGEITGARQQDAGINFYIWQAVGDERVRGNPMGKYPRAIPSHWAIDGKLCRWDDPTVYSEDGGKTWIPRTALMPKAHPGQEILCRCAAIPYLDNLFTEEATQVGAVPVVDADKGPSPESALASLDNIMKGNAILPLDRWIAQGAGPDIAELFKGADWSKAPEKTLFFKHLTRTQPSLSRETLRAQIAGDLPPAPIHAVKYNGSTYLMGEHSHTMVAAKSMLGEYRAKMMVLDGDEFLKVRGPTPDLKSRMTQMFGPGSNMVLSEGSYERSYQALQEFEKLTGIPAEKIVAPIGEALHSSSKSTTMTVFKSSGWNTVTFQASGEGQITRRFLEHEFLDDRITVDHDLFRLPRAARGQGRAKALLKSHFEAYFSESSKVANVTVHAALDNGAYTWARFGFVPTQSSWRTLLNSLRREPQSEEVSAFLSKLSQNNPRHLWLLADSKWGKELLSGDEWLGEFDLSDSTAVSRLNSYLKTSFVARSK